MHTNQFWYKAVFQACSVNGLTLTNFSQTSLKHINMDTYLWAVLYIITTITVLLLNPQ